MACQTIVIRPSCSNDPCLQLVSGLTTSAVFGLGGLWTLSGEADKHEAAHQASTLASMLFAGAMGYRASANPYVGPGGNMLAALGLASSAYHFAKTVEWREFGRRRAQEAERQLAQYRQTGGPAPSTQEPGYGSQSPPSGSALPFGLPRAPPGGF